MYLSLFKKAHVQFLSHNNDIESYEIELFFLAALSQVRSGFVAGVALSQGRVSISWLWQRFRKVGCNLFVAGGFRKIRYRFGGRRSAFARSAADFVAGAT